MLQLANADTCNDILPRTTNVDEPCSESDLLKCSKALQSWEEMAVCLGLSYPEIMEIKHNYSSNYGEQKFKMLMIWRRKNGSCANYRTLLKVAVTIRDQQFSDFVKQLLVKPELV